MDCTLDDLRTGLERVTSRWGLPSTDQRLTLMVIWTRMSVQDGRAQRWGDVRVHDRGAVPSGQQWAGGDGGPAETLRLRQRRVLDGRGRVLPASCASEFCSSCCCGNKWQTTTETNSWTSEWHQDRSVLDLGSSMVCPVHLSNIMDLHSPQEPSWRPVCGRWWSTLRWCLSPAWWRQMPLHWWQFFSLKSRCSSMTMGARAWRQNWETSVSWHVHSSGTRWTRPSPLWVVQPGRSPSVEPQNLTSSHG